MLSSTNGLTATSPGPGALQSASVSTGSAKTAAASSRWTSDTQQIAQQALATLKQAASRGAAKDAAKNAAAQKLAQLKAQLKNLMMFGGDPKTRASEAARIAKQIGEVAKEYAQAGGSAPTAAVTSPGNATVSTGSADAGVSSDGSEPVPLPAGMDSTQASPITQTAVSDSESTDRTFITDARLLARQANAILKNAVLAAHRQKRRIGQTGAEGDQALTVIDNTAYALGRDGGVGTDTSAGYGASAQSVAIPAAAIITATA